MARIAMWMSCQPFLWSLVASVAITSRVVLLNFIEFLRYSVISFIILMYRKNNKE